MTARPFPDFRLRFVFRVSSPNEPSASPFKTNSENMVAISRGCNAPFGEYHWYNQLHMPRMASVVMVTLTGRNSPEAIPCSRT